MTPNDHNPMAGMLSFWTRRISRTSRRIAALVLVVGLVVPATTHAELGIQTVTLDDGWNAVWLEIEPVDANGDPKAPQDVFNNAAISVIATPKQLAGLAEFFGDAPVDADDINQGPTSQFNEGGWEIWLRTDPSGDSNLVMTFGSRPYLIHVDPGTGQFGLPLTGKARFFRPTWTPDRYNLVGFHTNGTITFQDFFAPSGGAHPVGKIYELDAATGAWSIVTAGDPILPDTAYWIFSDGPSDYMGPVAVDFDLAGTGRLSFGGPGDAVTVDVDPDTLVVDLEDIVLTNLDATNTAVPELDLIKAEPGMGSLKLHVVRPTADNLAWDRRNEVDPVEMVTVMPSDIEESIAPQTSGVLTLGAERAWSSTPAARTNLYRLRTGGGNEVWLPIHAVNSDVPPDTVSAPPMGSLAGLWVGEAIIDSVTSIVEDGEPVRKAASKAPVRIILHSDASDVVSLLSHVTIMQTKTADPDVEPVPVLVVDQAKIPFFEGIKERNGKLVGIRIEAVAYDMPRKLDINTQAALVAKAALQVPQVVLEDEQDVLDFLLARSLRHPNLVEDYKLSLTMNGNLGAGQTVGTTEGSLGLDPFHRSNPFRHAFHQQHARGANISREIEIVFDTEQPIAGRLNGTFSDTLKGITKSDLQLTGRVTLERVSAVDTLE